MPAASDRDLDLSRKLGDCQSLGLYICARLACMHACTVNDQYWADFNYGRSFGDVRHAYDTHAWLYACVIKIVGMQCTIVKQSIPTEMMS